MYDTRLSIDEVLSRLAEQPKEIAALTAGVPGARLRRSPGRGQWSANDVLAHLRSCSDMWGQYMATIVRDDHPTIRAMNPRTWIKRTSYPDLEFAASFRSFRRQRAELLSLLRQLPNAAWSRTALVTGAGRPRERTVLEYARWLANHERTHVQQIRRLVPGPRSRTAAAARALR